MDLKQRIFFPKTSCDHLSGYISLGHLPCCNGQFSHWLLYVSGWYLRYLRYIHQSTWNRLIGYVSIHAQPFFRLEKNILITKNEWVKWTPVCAGEDVWLFKASFSFRFIPSCWDKWICLDYHDQSVTRAYRHVAACPCQGPSISEAPPHLKGKGIGPGQCGWGNIMKCLRSWTCKLKNSTSQAIFVLFQLHLSCISPVASRQKKIIQVCRYHAPKILQLRYTFILLSVWNPAQDSQQNYGI